MNRIWISKSLREALSTYAAAKFPLETGGVLMGYWGEGDVVVCQAVGPGPGAQHEAFRFVPDYEFHEAEVARIYRESGGRWSYLGDWHSHPKQTKAELSKQDVRTLRRIGSCREARAPVPVMLVVPGGPRAWGQAAWKLPSAKPFWRSPNPVSLRVEFYQSEGGVGARAIRLGGPGDR